MAELLFITPQEIAKTTVIGGNVDIDKYQFAIYTTQLQVILPLLGTELYDKLKTDFENNNLAGLYLVLFEKFVKPILKNQTTARYIEVASYTVDNGGIYKHEAENETVPDRQEIEAFANGYRGNAQVIVEQFYKWICLNHLPEYKRHQDEVNATRNMGLMNGLYFGTSQDGTKWGNYEGTMNRGCNCKNDGNDCCD